MKHRTTAAAAVAAALMTAAATACSGGSAGSTAASPAAAGTRTPEQAAQTSSATVSTAKAGKLGTILVDSKGMTLYLFQADKNGKPTCNGSCAKAWPPLVVTGKAGGAGGVQSAKLSTAKRSDGSTQVVYNGHPLYHFAGDSKAGNTNGQGLDNFGAKWYVLGTNGKQITTKVSQPSTPGGGGY
ncbi:COG4315 family predicted lipoprotein [Actinacidiphila guanduensis]|uniref:Predicted lipoprotein with conserved Yx(FWY)xxD motif n=1 Tax=Actinacidiphila guanduensis TaxID=310781 RepID=A0A1H0BSY6_9ACTN|nr:hypothetical protein [Actinacidiphila guanduensis]SDN48707.1 Predicted lipoprotein with conserved Yx(FWY)xxD motif [Actinacidiphila guanduensis]